MFKRVSVDSRSVDAVKRYIGDMFSHVAVIDDEIVTRNICMACNHGMSKFDRTISKANISYLINNYPVILGQMVTNLVFRFECVSAIVMETRTDLFDKNHVLPIRKKNPNKSSELGPKMIIDLSKYDSEVDFQFNRTVIRSMDRFINYPDGFDDCNLINDEDIMEDIGFCICNFMYFIRAFEQNYDFRKSVIEAVEDKIDEIEDRAG